MKHGMQVMPFKGTSRQYQFPQETGHFLTTVVEGYLQALLTVRKSFKEL
jgi:hypothetical protein